MILQCLKSCPHDWDNTPIEADRSKAIPAQENKRAMRVICRDKFQSQQQCEFLPSHIEDEDFLSAGVADVDAATPQL
jgi:hypothetical protein